MENEGKWPIDKYSQLNNGRVWVETTPEPGSGFIVIKGSQFFVLNNGVAVESLCLLGGAGNIKCFYSNQNLGVTTISKGQILKFRVRFFRSVGKSNVENCLEVVEILKKYSTVVEHPTHRGRKISGKDDFTTKSLLQVAKELLNKQNSSEDSDVVLSEECIQERVQLCLLDPGFPRLVSTVESMLEE